MITYDEIRHSEVRALWWKQPFASLMLYGKQETRSWNTDYRGLVLVCASKKPYAGEEMVKICGYEQYKRIHATLPVSKLLQGHAIAIGRLKGVKRMGDYPFIKPEIEAKTFVQWNADLFIHEYEDVREIRPFPFPGAQGWRTLNYDQKTLISFKQIDKPE